ncbi:MAG: branched-chain amino acid ABC transporter permease [Chloroflexi bacterium]|nr:branched-chain amino acid ABC transporter permease [Chloroflexota bacterium]
MGILRPAGEFDRSYEYDQAIFRRPWQIYLAITIIVVLYAIPFWGSPLLISTVNRICYTLIAVQGLNILTGYTGQISLGQASFMLVGGFASALFSIHLGFPIFLSIPAAAIVSGGVGLLFGLPSLRVKGFYLAMATLAAQFILPWLSRQPFLQAYLGGTEGFIKVPVTVLFGVDFGELSSFVLISITVVLITTVLTVNISRTRLGRALVAVRDNDLAAELLGVNLFSYKLQAFFLAALLAGIAGALRAHSERGVGVELGYDITDSVLFLGMLVIGGLGTNLGPYLGTIFVIVLDLAARSLGDELAAFFPGQAAQLQSSFRPIMFGLILVLFLIFEPRGLAHRWSLLKASWRLRPFAR